MSEHLTEEEQLEALKRWWKENGKNTVAAVVVAVGGYFGFEFWQEQARIAQEQASDKYQTLIEAVVTAPGETATDIQLATAASLAAELKDEAATSFYGQSAALFMAKVAVEANELDRAEAELKWLLAQNPEQGVSLVTHLRLARIQSAAGKYDEALTTLGGQEEGRFAATFAETRGDIFLRQGNSDAARSAYQMAFQLSAASGASSNNTLQSKLDDLSAAIPPQPLAASEVAQ